jgi:hypothetical protein
MIYKIYFILLIFSKAINIKIKFIKNKITFYNYFQNYYINES